MTLYLDDRGDIDNETVARMNPAYEKGLCHNVRKYAREYNEVTGIHGLRYLTEKRSRTEKIIWVILLSLSLAGCIYMIYEVLYKYNNSPVVVSFATEDTPLHQIPFPAITICPEFKYSRQKFNFSEVYRKLAENEEVDDAEYTLYTYKIFYSMRDYQYLGLLCEETIQGNKTVDNRFFEAIDELKPIGDDILPFCIYMDRPLPCKEIFTPIIVDEGICYSFNILGRDEVFRKHVYHYADYYHIRNTSRQVFDIETGYEEGAGINTYPRRALTSGADNSLAIFFEYDTSETDFVCNNFLQGFRVLIHNPWEVPRLSKHYFRIPFDKVIVAAMYPEMVTTSREVRRFKPEKRKCYMVDERPLKHFQKYTQSNCLLECLTNYTLNECGCVRFFMPRESDTAICGVGSSECVDKAEVEIKVKELEYKMLGKTFCDCKPSCTQLTFNVETSHSDFYFREYFKTVHQQYFTDNTSHWSVLEIYFKEEQFITKERNELYGTSDLISNLGGLLGLFTGFSLISLAEIIYFLSLRIFCNDKMYGRWSGPPN